MATLLAASGTQTANVLSINAVSAANPAQLDTTAVHSLVTGDRVVVRDHLITATSLPNTTVNNDATSAPIHAVTFVDTDSVTLDGINNASAGGVTGTVSQVHTLASLNAPGIYQLYVDLVNMAANDVMQFLIEYITLTGGTRRNIVSQTFYGVQPFLDRAWVSVPIGEDLTDTAAIRFCLVQHYGTTGRAYPWKVLRYV